MVPVPLRVCCIPQGYPGPLFRYVTLRVLLGSSGVSVMQKWNEAIGFHALRALPVLNSVILKCRGLGNVFPYPETRGEGGWRAGQERKPLSLESAARSGVGGWAWRDQQWSCHLWFIHLRKWIPRCPGTTKAHSTYTLIDRLMNITLGFLRALTGCFLLGPLFTCFWWLMTCIRERGFPRNTLFINFNQHVPHPIFSNQFVLTSYRCITGDHHSSAQIQPLLCSLPVFQFAFPQAQDCMIPESCPIAHEPFLSVIPLGQDLRYPWSQLLLLLQIHWVREGESSCSGVLKLQGSQKDRLGAFESFEKSTAWPVFSLRKWGSALWGSMWQLLGTASHLQLAVGLSNAGHGGHLHYRSVPLLLPFLEAVSLAADICPLWMQ